MVEINKSNGDKNTRLYKNDTLTKQFEFIKLNLRALHIKIVLCSPGRRYAVATYKSPSIGDDDDDIRSINSNNVLFSFMYLFHYHTSRSWLFWFFYPFSFKCDNYEI